MKIIKKLSELIEEELEGAEGYIRMALKYRDDMPELSRTMYTISTQEMEHVEKLHGEVTKIIQEYRAKEGEPPAAMLAVYEYLHGKHIDKAAHIKSMQTMYREG